MGDVQNGLALLARRNGEALTEILAEIDAPHFYCGIVLQNDKVIEVADIVRYMRGWSRDRVRRYCVQKGWRISVIEERIRNDRA